MSAETFAPIHQERLDEIEAFYRHESTPDVIREDVQWLVDEVRRLAALTHTLVPRRAES